MNLFAEHYLSRQRFLLELLVGVSLAIVVGLGIVLMGAAETKYQMAVLLGCIGFGTLCLFPERRILCVLLWFMIHPLSVEKVFFIGAPLHTGFAEQAIVINASDAILAILALFLFLEQLFGNKRVFYWPRIATPLVLLLLWGVVSYSIHVFYLKDGLGAYAPFAMLDLLRVLLLMFVLHAAIRTRDELLALLLVVLLMVAGESLLMGLSYVTGDPFNFAKLIGAEQQLGLQTFSSHSGESLSRATATLGHVNQQAVYHVMYTTPLIAFFVVKRHMWKGFALCVIAGSLMAILLTFSRSAWLSSFVAILVMLALVFYLRMFSRMAWLVAAFMMVFGSVLMGIVAQPVYERLVYGDDGATDSRLRMIELAFDLYMKHPFIGVGIGNFSEATLKYYPPGYSHGEWLSVGESATVPTVGRLEVVTYVDPKDGPISSPLPVHNRYLLFLTELGVIGLLLVAWFYWRFYQNCRFCMASKQGVYRFMGVGGIGALSASLVYMNLDLFADYKSLSILLFMPILVSIVTRIMVDENRQENCVRQNPEVLVESK